MDECTLASTTSSFYFLFCWRLKHSSRSLRMNLFSWIYILSRFCDWTVYMLIFICECWTDCGCVPGGGVYSKLRNAHAQIWVRMWAPAETGPCSALIINSWRTPRMEDHIRNLSFTWLKKWPTKKEKEREKKWGCDGKRKNRLSAPCSASKSIHSSTSCSLKTLFSAPLLLAFPVPS